MTLLVQYDDRAPHEPCARFDDLDDIADALASTGVILDRWTADAVLSDAADDTEILAAYAGEIERLKARGGYQSVDVIRLTPDHPQRSELRAKFLSEHVHDDDEVRFFVEGAGLFYIHADNRVYALECTEGDLIVLPAGVRHWFDMGERPRFTAIRLFTTPDGWVARFTDDAIAQAIPLYEGAL